MKTLIKHRVLRRLKRTLGVYGLKKLSQRTHAELPQELSQRSYVEVFKGGLLSQVHMYWCLKKPSQRTYVVVFKGELPSQGTQTVMFKGTVSENVGCGV